MEESVIGNEAEKTEQFEIVTMGELLAQRDLKCVPWPTVEEKQLNHFDANTAQLRYIWT